MFFEKGTILFSNSHSYTATDFSVNNNHWLAAVIFYGIQDMMGFSLLHILCALAYLITFITVLNYFNKWKYPIWSLLIGILALPLFATHNIVAPVLFTHLFSCLFFIVLYQFINGKVPSKSLFVLPVLQMIWVNTHHYFMIGWGLLLLAVLAAFFNQKKKALRVGIVTVISLVLSVVHPKFIGGITGAFQDVFSSAIILPIWERTLLDGYIITHSYVLLYGLVLFFISIGAGLLAIKQKQVDLFTLSGVFLLIFFAYWSSQLLVLLALPIVILLSNLVVYYSAKKEQCEVELLLSYSPLVLFVYMSIPVFITGGFYQPINNWGYGIAKEELNISNFLAQSNLKGPIFHNTLVSGLLTYSIPEEQCLYISSQPKAHPIDFYDKEYFPSVLDPFGWKLVHDKYLFNAVVFRLKGAATSELEFMGNLLGNGKWSMVYYKEDYEVILVKNKKENQSIIDRYVIDLQNKQTN